MLLRHFRAAPQGMGMKEGRCAARYFAGHVGRLSSYDNFSFIWGPLTPADIARIADEKDVRWQPSTSKPITASKHEMRAMVAAGGVIEQPEYHDLTDLLCAKHNYEVHFSRIDFRGLPLNELFSGAPDLEEIVFEGLDAGFKMVMGFWT